jgi:KRAB domain-containing zinc finger protein
MAVTCDICFKECQCLNELQVHINSHVEARYRRYHCRLCSATFNEKNTLASHLRRHSNHKNKCHMCRWCGRFYALASELAVHEKVHTERPYECTECNSKHPSRKALRYHTVTTHTDKRPYTCKECGETFKQLFHYNKHVFAQHADKVFACAVCNKKFVVRNTLLSHLGKKHGIAIDKPNECSICGKKFVNGRHLSRHERLHLAEQYQCQHCDKTFAAKEYLQFHIKQMHSVQKPRYQCRQCSKSFNHSNNRRRHEREVHDNKKFNCDICGVVLASKECVKAHLVRIYNSKTPIVATITYRAYNAYRVLVHYSLACSLVTLP